MEFNSNPKKYKKYHKVRYKGLIRFNQLIFGKFGLKVLKHLKLDTKTLIFFIKILKRFLKIYDKGIKIVFRVFPDFGVTNKPKDIRMGRGKGIVAYKVCNIRCGTIFLELINVSNKRVAFKALHLCMQKIGVPCKIIHFECYD